MSSRRTLSGCTESGADSRTSSPLPRTRPIQHTTSQYSVDSGLCAGLHHMESAFRESGTIHSTGGSQSGSVRAIHSTGGSQSGSVRATHEMNGRRSSIIDTTSGRPAPVNTVSASLHGFADLSALDVTHYPEMANVRGETGSLPRRSASLASQAPHHTRTTSFICSSEGPLIPPARRAVSQIIVAPPDDYITHSASQPNISPLDGSGVSEGATTSVSDSSGDNTLTDTSTDIPDKARDHQTALATVTKTTSVKTKKAKPCHKMSQVGYTVSSKYI